jgi:hypothetical protein
VGVDALKLAAAPRGHVERLADEPFRVSAAPAVQLAPSEIDQDVGLKLRQAELPAGRESDVELRPRAPTLSLRNQCRSAEPCRPHTMALSPPNPVQ